MAGAGAPRPLRLLMSLFYAAAAFHVSNVPESDILLKFKTTISGADAALPDWTPGSKPCLDGERANWTGVICVNGTVYGLQLENMSLSGSLNLDGLAELPYLRTLSFMNNGFEGRMPSLEKMKALKGLFLSRNRFSGEIPGDAFEGFQSLKKLHLSQNSFTGRIPASLVSTSTLLELRLDGNSFTGAIPDLRPPDLKLANFSYNNLEGRIPDGLSKLDASFFQGNKNLCGAPLNVECLLPSQASNNKFFTPLMIAIMVLAIAVLLAILALILLLICRRNENARPLQPSSSKFSRIEPLDAEKVVQHGPAEYIAVAAAGGGRKGPKDVEHGKLVFVREGRERFELQDLLKASAEVLGSGNFGSSYKAMLLSGPSVVVKRFREMNGVGREEFQEHMRRLGRLSHPNLLPLVAYYYRKEEKLLMTDYIPNGSLAHHLHGSRGSNLPLLEWPTRLKIVKGVARGLAYLLDELPMLTLPHGHLKSSNVLLDASYEPLLMDYALVPVMNQSHASQIMVAYKSPEYAEYGRTSKKSDVWSLGILILEILTGRFPANYLKQGKAGTDLASWVHSVVREEWTPEVFDGEMKGMASCEEEMFKLLKIGLACCEEDVEKRWELKEALEKIEELEEMSQDGDYSSNNHVSEEGEVLSSIEI